MSREAAVSDYFQKSERRHPAAILIEQAVSSQLWASDVHTWVVKGTPGTEKRKRSSWILTEGALPFLSLACSPPFFFLLFRHDEGVGLCVPSHPSASSLCLYCLRTCVLPCQYKAPVYCVQYDVSLWETVPTVMSSEINLDFKCHMNVSSMDTCVKMPHF